MLNFHLQKRRVSLPGMVLLSFYCILGMGLIGYSSYSIHTGKLSASLLTGHIFYIMFLLTSLIAPVASFLKPGFAYKGHPGLRHMSTLLSGFLIVAVAGINSLNSVLYEELFKNQEFVISSPVYLFYGLTAIIQYWSFFKGPTSRYGQVFQPYLPTLE